MSRPPSRAEKRQSQRFVLPLTLGVRARFSDGQSAELVDLSATGFQVLRKPDGGEPPPRDVATLTAGFLAGTVAVERAHVTPLQAGYRLVPEDVAAAEFVAGLQQGLARGGALAVRHEDPRRIDLVSDRGDSLILGLGPDRTLTDGSLLCVFEHRRVGLTYRRGLVGFLNNTNATGRFSAEEERLIGVATLLLSGVAQESARRAVQPWIEAIGRLSEPVRLIRPA